MKYNRERVHKYVAALLDGDFVDPRESKALLSLLHTHIAYNAAKEALVHAQARARECGFGEE
jgi:hypothetical protein